MIKSTIPPESNYSTRITLKVILDHLASVVLSISSRHITKPFSVKNNVRTPMYVSSILSTSTDSYQKPSSSLSSYHTLGVTSQTPNCCTQHQHNPTAISTSQHPLTQTLKSTLPFNGNVIARFKKYTNK